MYLCKQLLGIIVFTISYCICIDQHDFKVFAPTDKDPCLPQYAVLYMPAERMTDPFDPPPTGYNEDILQVGNNYAATCMNNTIRDSHTEPTVLDYFDQLTSKFKEKYDDKYKPDLYLYTRSSPCTNCASIIAQFTTTKMNGIANNVLQLAWTKTYVRRQGKKFIKDYEKKHGQPPTTPHQQFLQSMETLLASERVKLVLSPDAKWLQGRMRLCLNEKDDIDTFFKRDREQNMANIVNRLAYHCGKKSRISEAEKWECWVEQLQESLKRTCPRLEEHIKDCLEEFGTTLEIGPPLSSQYPGLVSSNNKDLVGYYIEVEDIIFDNCVFKF